jgi:hypothetical protein
MRSRILPAVCITLLFTLPVFGQEATKTQDKKKILTPQQRATVTATQRLRLQLAPGEQVITIAAAAFINTYPNMSSWSNLGDRVHNTGSGGSHNYVAPLILPHGARVTRMAMVINEHEDNVVSSVWLVRKDDYIPPELGDQTDISASIASTGVPGAFNLHTGPDIENLVIDNLTGTYFLQLNLSQESVFRSIKIFYTVE